MTEECVGVFPETNIALLPGFVVDVDLLTAATDGDDLLEGLYFERNPLVIMFESGVVHMIHPLFKNKTSFRG